MKSMSWFFGGTEVAGRGIMGEDNGKIEYQLYVTALWLMLALAKIRELEASRCVVFDILEKSSGMFDDTARVVMMINEVINQLDQRVTVLEKLYGVRSIEETIKNLWGFTGCGEGVNGD